jgi:hypothetical protein
MVIFKIFYTNFILTKRERSHMVIFQLDVVHNSLNKLLQKSMDENLSPFVTQRCSLSFISHIMVPSAFMG